MIEPRKMVRVVYFVVLYLVFLLGVRSEVDVGYPVGYLSNCPGFDKPAMVAEETLKKHLFISIMGPGTVLSGHWTRYRYHEIGRLAEHPDMDFSKKTFLYVGGWLDTTTLPIARSFAEIYRKMGYNALMLDTLSFTANNYPIASRLIRQIGKHAAIMLANLTTLGLDPKTLQLVGLSLGGQTMSFIAKHYRELTGRNISTLIALDPAGPCFRHQGPKNRLDASDADFVVDIVTNSEGYGMATPLGHVTFYVNGGENQVGHLKNYVCNLECSHLTVILLWFSALLNPGGFIGIQCESVQDARDRNCYDKKPMVTNTMDLYTDRSKPGIYFVPTFGRFPYAVGKKGLLKRNRFAILRLRSLQELRRLR